MDKKSKKKENLDRVAQVRIPIPVYQSLEKDADKNYRTVSATLRMLIDQYLDKQSTAEEEYEEKEDKK